MDFQNQSWRGREHPGSQVAKGMSRVTVSDLDSMLPDTELRDAKLLFWRRYKLRFPPELHPSDSTVSRVARETEKRMLCVYNLWKVKSLQFQLHCTQKKRKLGDGLYTDEVEDEEPSSHDADAYLDKLHTLLIAYAIAGASPLPGAPAAADEAALGADSTLFVAVPLDVAMSYYLRAKRTSNLMPAAKRLAWLQARDAEERAEWVSRFRERASSLGSVIRTVYLARDAHWIPQQSSLPAEMLTFPPVPTPVKAPGTTLPSQFALGKSVGGRKVAKTMKDGTRLCPAFQGQCKTKGPCAQGAHRCG